jgi:hypothetical protein
MPERSEGMSAGSYPPHVPGLGRQIRQYSKAKSLCIVLIAVCICIGTAAF